jgi:hypothetical protein
LRTIAKSEAEVLAGAEAEGVAGSTAKRGSQCGSDHVIEANLTALWQIRKGLGETNADQSSSDDEGLHG